MVEEGEGVGRADFAEGGFGFGGAEAAGVEGGEGEGEMGGEGGEGEEEGEEGVEEEGLIDVHCSERQSLSEASSWRGTKYIKRECVGRSTSDPEGKVDKGRNRGLLAVHPDSDVTATKVRVRSTGRQHGYRKSVCTHMCSPLLYTSRILFYVVASVCQLGWYRF